MREGWFERDGVRFHYLEWEAPESDAEPIVFLHGLSSNARFWERVAGRLGGRPCCKGVGSLTASGAPGTGREASRRKCVGLRCGALGRSGSGRGCRSDRRAGRKV